MKIILHIGTEKTGTSSIQHFLKRESAFLYRGGILVPNALRQNNGVGDTHLALAALFCDREEKDRLLALSGKEECETEVAYRDRIFSSLCREVGRAKSDGVGTLLISSEHLSSRLSTRNSLEKLKEFLGEFGCVEQVVVYLRRQDRFLVSSYSTELKSGRIRPFNIPNPDWARHRYDYRHLLTLWGSVFGENVICVRPFEAGRFECGGVVGDFLKTIELQYRGDVGNVNRNPMLDLKGMSIMLRFNQWIKSTETVKDVAGLRRMMVFQLERRASGPKMQLSGKDALEFVERYASGNEWVSRRFLGGERLFSEAIDPLQEERMPPEYPGPAVFELLSDVLFQLEESNRLRRGMGVSSSISRIGKILGLKK